MISNDTNLIPENGWNLFCVLKMFPPKIDIPFPFVLRWVTSVCILDYTTVAIGDKFGSVSIVRLPSSINDNVDEDPTGTKSLWDRGVLNGASQKAECICVIHIGEIPLSLQKGKVQIFWEGHKIWKNLPLKRSIFQTFWKPHCCTKFLFLEIMTTDLHHRPGFDQIFWFWTQIGPAQW